MAINLISKEDFCKYIKVDKLDEERFIKRIYEPVLNNVKELSNLWEFCYNNNLKFLVSEYDRQQNILFNKIIDIKKNKINYNEVSNIYLNLGRYFISNYNIIKIMRDNDSGNFRGHDFFSLLYFYIKRKDIILNIDKLGNIDGKFIEEYFIEQSSKDQWIKKSKLYKDIKNKFNDIFE